MAEAFVLIEAEVARLQTVLQEIRAVGGVKEVRAVTERLRRRPFLGVCAPRRRSGAGSFPQRATHSARFRRLRRTCGGHGGFAGPRPGNVSRGPPGRSAYPRGGRPGVTGSGRALRTRGRRERRRDPACRMGRRTGGKTRGRALRDPWGFTRGALGNATAGGRTQEAEGRLCACEC